MITIKFMFLSTTRHEDVLPTNITLLHSCGEDFSNVVIDIGIIYIIPSI